jgi:CheY-like chemotaxis protein
MSATYMSTAATDRPLFNRILIANGNPDTLGLYCRALDDVADAVMASDDGAEALGKAVCHPPDLVIIESRLRRIDGLVLCGLLRDDPLTRHASIIVLTAASHVHELSRAHRAGADRVLLNPCPPGRLRAAAQDLGGSRRCPPPPATPRLMPPALLCPSCLTPLHFETSVVTGVKATREQTDNLRCPQCGPYEYRHRTRTLMPIL